MFQFSQIIVHQTQNLEPKRNSSPHKHLSNSKFNQDLVFKKSDSSVGVATTAKKPGSRPPQLLFRGEILFCVSEGGGCDRRFISVFLTHTPRAPSFAAAAPLTPAFQRNARQRQPRAADNSKRQPRAALSQLQASHNLLVSCSPAARLTRTHSQLTQRLTSHSRRTPATQHAIYHRIRQSERGAALPLLSIRSQRQGSARALAP